MRVIDKDTKLFISVSAKPGNLGARVYNYLFAKHGINAIYIPRLAPTSADQLLDSIRTLSISGCSVSMPLKSLIASALDNLDKIAAETRSVNTVVNRGGKLFGYNTDYAGIVEVLSKRKWGSTLIYGAGGVVGSLVLALNNRGAGPIYLTARNERQGRSCAEKLKLKYASLEELSGPQAPSIDLLISATPIGFDQQLGALAKLIPQARCVFDLVPSLETTCVLKTASDLGKECISGIEMFKAQVVEQFSLYTEVKTSLAEVEQAFKSNS